MPTPGQFDPATGAIWNGTAWVGGQGTAQAPAAGAPARPTIAAQTPPFPGAILIAQAQDGTTEWRDPTTGRVRAYRGGAEIGSLLGGVTQQGPTSPAQTSASVGAGAYDPNGTSGPISGMTNIQVDTYRQQAQNALKQLGVLDYQPTNAELRTFFTSGFDAEAIGNYYMTDPTMVARQPGLPYGVSRETYQQNLAGYQQAWQTSFGGQPFPGAPKAGATPGDINQNLVGYAMKQGISPTQFGQTVEQYRQRTGKAPTQADFASFQQQTAQEAVSPRGGTAQVTGGPLPAQQTPARPAIGGRK